MNDKVIKLLLGVIAVCLCVLLLKDTTKSVQAQSQARRMTDEQPQIVANGSTVYILLDRKLYVYSWESNVSKQASKAFGEPKLSQVSVIDLSAPH